MHFQSHHKYHQVFIVYDIKWLNDYLNAYHSFAYMCNLSDIVIDKPTGLGGTIYIRVSIHVIYMYHMYQNKRFISYICNP